MLDTGLAGKVALVTGANHGIGAATAAALAAQGAAVFVAYFGPPAPGAGAGRTALEVDLADPANIPRLFDAVEAALGGVDVLVNNAAVGGSPKDTFILHDDRAHDDRARDRFARDLETITAASHDRHFAVNSRATALLMAEYARRHLARGARWGRIVNVSTDGADCFPGEVSYGASKAALEAYSRAAAIELAPQGVTVNIVAPGPIQTGWIAPELEGEIARTIPLGRLGRPEDVADAIVLLASEQARWLTGQLLWVGGGHRM